MKNLNLPYPVQIFVFGYDKSLGEEIAKLSKVKIANHKITCFSNCERIPHQIETVRGRDVYIIFTSLNGEETDKWALDYLRFVYSVKNGQPHKITVIMPKLIHQRQDKENRDLRQPKLSDLFPKLLKTAGMNYMVVCKLHNDASCTTDPPMENLPTTRIIIESISLKFDLSKIVVASADIGGAKYARKIAEELRAPLIIVDKDRDQGIEKTKTLDVFTKGEISKKIDTVIFVDDITATFGSISDAADAVHEKHSQIVNFVGVTTHFDGNKSTITKIINSRIKVLIITNTVPISNEFLSILKNSGVNVIIPSVAKLIAQTINNLHNGQSISALWTKNGD